MESYAMDVGKFKRKIIYFISIDITATSNFSKETDKNIILLGKADQAYSMKLTSE